MSHPTHILSDAEEALPQTAALATSTPPKYDDKHQSEFVEDKQMHVEHEENSPEEILQRYPLLRNLSQKELDKLNRRVKRRM